MTDLGNKKHAIPGKHHQSSGAKEEQGQNGHVHHGFVSLPQVQTKADQKGNIGHCTGIKTDPHHQWYLDR